MKEIERKFLLKDGYEVSDFLYIRKNNISDVYLNENTRIRYQDGLYFITIKSKGTLSRMEYTYELNSKPEIFEDRNALNKVRFTVPYKNQNFELNLFMDINYKNKPLVLIELELATESQVIHIPEWVGEEVTNDEKFYGFNLSKILNYTDFSVTS